MMKIAGWFLLTVGLFANGIIGIGMLKNAQAHPDFKGIGVQILVSALAIVLGLMLWAGGRRPVG